MIKIIPQTYYLTCNSCGCHFSCEEEDIRVFVDGFETRRPYVFCPKCDKKIRIKFK